MTQELTYSAIQNPPFNLVFPGSGKEALRITHGGELIFADAGDAAQALLREWKRLRAADQADDTTARFRRALEAIQQKIIDGQVCDDVAWFDKFTTLHDFIDEVLHPSPPPVIADLFSGGESAA